MPSSGMVTDAHMGIGGDTHMALIVDGGELQSPLKDAILILQWTHALKRHANL
jgi:hypothetical protein